MCLYIDVTVAPAAVVDICIHESVCVPYKGIEPRTVSLSIQALYHRS